jgi:quinol monooxygenase YgiN
MTVRLGILAELEAAPGKGAELAVFLQAGRELAVAEQGTVTWYAFKISDTRYGIFDTFETDEARQAHLNGEHTAAALLAHLAGDDTGAIWDVSTAPVRT